MHIINYDITSPKGVLHDHTYIYIYIYIYIWRVPINIITSCNYITLITSLR